MPFGRIEVEFLMAKKNRPGGAERRAASRARSQEANAVITEAKAKLLPRPSRVYRVDSDMRKQESTLEKLGEYGFSWPEPDKPCESRFPLQNWTREDRDASNMPVDDFMKEENLPPFEEMEIRPKEFWGVSRRLGSVTYWQKGKDGKYVFIEFTYSLHERNGERYWDCQAVFENDRDFKS
jgi:hypothetical protein